MVKLQRKHNMSLQASMETNSSTFFLNTTQDNLKIEETIAKCFTWAMKVRRSDTDRDIWPALLR